MNKIISASFLALSLAAAGAQAQAVRTEKNMSLELANQIAAASVLCSVPTMLARTRWLPACKKLSLRRRPKTIRWP
jgi:hypothetical protein